MNSPLAGQYKLVIGLLMLLNHAQALAVAAPASANNDPLYYQIGGARSVFASPAASTTNVMNASLELGLGYSCGKFDPVAGLKTSVAKVTRITDTLAMAVQGAISALPLLILQRVNPGLYDLLQNLIIKGEAALALANSSCEHMEAEIKKGNNPYEAWTDLSKMLDWKVEMRAGNTDVLGAKEKIERQNGQNGIPWVNGIRSGGMGQPQIHITRDVVKAGYNALGSAGTRVGELWKTADAAATAAVDALGEVMIGTYDEHVDQAKAGRGLLPLVAEHAQQSTAALTALVDGSKSPSLDNLRAASSNDVLVTGELIKALQDLPPTEKHIVTNKLAAEVGVSKTLEAAVYLRRMLLAGKREPNVVKTAAVNHIDDVLGELDREVDELLFEQRIHQELVSGTALAVLANARHQQMRGKLQQPAVNYDASPLEDGAVR